MFFECSQFSLGNDFGLPGFLVHFFVVVAAPKSRSGFSDACVASVAIVTNGAALVMDVPSFSTVKTKRNTVRQNPQDSDCSNLAELTSIPA